MTHILDFILSLWLATSIIYIILYLAVRFGGLK